MQEHSEAEKAALIAAAEKEAGSLRAELSSGQAQLREASERSSMLQRCNEQLSDFQARAREEADLWRQVSVHQRKQQRASNSSSEQAEHPQPSHSHTHTPLPPHATGARDGGGEGDDDGE